MKKSSKKNPGEEALKPIKNEKPVKKKRWLIFLLTFLSIVIVGLSVYGVAHLSKFYFDFEHPIGDEAVAMMGKIKFIDNNFPNFNWNHQWDAGQPGFWIYLPFPFFVGTLFVRLFSLTYAHSLALLSLISYIFIGIGVYGITHRLSRNRLTAILAAILAMTSQGIWYWNGAGYYARTFAMGFYFLALWSAIALVQKLQKQKKFFPLPKTEFFLTILFFFLTCYSHAFSNYLLVGTLFVLFVVTLSGWRKKLYSVVFVIGTGIFLSAFYYFLMLQANFEFYRNVIFHRDYFPHYLRLFWNLKVFEGYAGAPEVSPLILPLVAILFIWLIVSRKRFKGFAVGERRIFWVLFFFLIVSLYYPLQGLPYIPKLFFIFLLPCDAPFLVSVFGAVIIGVILATVLRNLYKWMRYAVPVILIGIIIWMSVQGALFVMEDKWPRRMVNPEEGFISRMEIDGESKQYRMGTTNPGWAESFNYYWDVSQNRDYFGQGVVYNDWQFWQQACIWDIECDYDHTDYLIDWFSLKWILTTASGVDTSYLKFSEKPEKYDLVYEEDPNYHEFIPKEVSPILSATNTPSVLIIGKENVAHDLFVRASALVNQNSQNIIPVKGKQYIDQHSAKELEKFDIIYLYEYKYKNRKKASQLLTKFVENGGGLIVEAMLSPEYLNNDRGNLFSPLPESGLSLYSRENDWSFEAKSHETTEDINFIKFSPAIYNFQYKWKVVSAKPYGGYETVLESDGVPVILAKELGEGRIIWMGMNFNYHVNDNRNLEEARFFENLIDWVSKKRTKNVEQVEYETEFIHPEKREIQVNERARGILNKEYYFPAWKAYLEKDGQKKNLKIYRGGLDQQYIPLPEDIEPPYKVTMVYGRWTSEKIGFVVSGITLLALLIYLFEGVLYPRFIGGIVNKLKGRVKSKTVSWWNKDEDE